MSELFVLEWSGGVAEHHFRRARPDDELPWESLDANKYSPELLAAAREVWTGVAVSEYAAIAAFSDVVGALAAVRAPLDLIGMTSDFLADEVYHVELASRLLMQLGGAARRQFEPTELAPKPSPTLTPLERANELALRIGCIAEPFASATAVPMMRETTHPLVRRIYETILRDEARHVRFGRLYFDWVGERLNGGEVARLGRVAASALIPYANLWRNAEASAAASPPWSATDVHELGWTPPANYAALARSAVKDEVLPSLARLGIVLSDAESRSLFSD